MICTVHMAYSLGRSFSWIKVAQTVIDPLAYKIVPVLTTYLSLITCYWNTTEHQPISTFWFGSLIVNLIRHFKHCPWSCWYDCHKFFYPDLRLSQMWQFQPLPALLHSLHIMITATVSNDQLVKFQLPLLHACVLHLQRSSFLQAVLCLWKWSLSVHWDQSHLFNHVPSGEIDIVAVVRIFIAPS